MIVKNESKIIRRCLTSTLGLIDAAVICDTGSTDNTVDIIHEVLDEKLGVDNVVVFTEPWQNFGYNRTVVMKRAREFVPEGERDTTYIVTIDADMELKYETFDKANTTLTASSYNIKQHHGTLVYDNRRILKATYPWVSEGVTHEFNTAVGAPGDHVRLDSIWILDHDDGGSKSNKSQRDIDLLEKGLVAEPNNVRYMFYLANTYRERGNYLKAIQWYRKHIKLGSFDEEVFYAHTYMGDCYERLSHDAAGTEFEDIYWGLALISYLRAYQKRPTRAESLTKIAHHYRVHNAGLACQGFPFALTAAQIPFPKNDSLFVEKAVYEHGSLEELSICASYANQPEVGLQAIDDLLNRHPPSGLHQISLYNLQFYAKPWGKFKWSPLNPLLPPHYRPCNPSLAFLPSASGDENPVMQVICRAVNYSQEGARNYVAEEGDGIFRTRNYYLTWDPQTRTVKSQTDMHTERWSGPYKDGTKVQGLEDCRLYYRGDRPYISATTLEITPDNRPKIVTAPILPDKTLGTVSLVPPMTDTTCEKNWLPFYDAEKGPQWLYKCDPVMLLSWDEKTNETQITTPTGEQWDIWYRGSAGPVVLPDDMGYLVLVHAVYDCAEYRKYYHKFLIFDLNWKLTHNSPYFLFKRSGVEMGLGMVLHPQDDILYVGMGIEDREAWIGEVSLSDVLEFCTAYVPPPPKVK